MADVLVERRVGYRVLTLNRPDRLNSFTAALHGALLAALNEAAADPECRALILTGAGRGFCAGQDLGERKPVPGEVPDASVTLKTLYNPLIRRLRDLPCPTICAVNGVAAGAGANVALACDLVLAARSASFLQAFSRIGLIPDAGGTWVLPRLVGRARAAGLALLAESLPAEKAESWGLIWRAVDDADLMTEAVALAERFAAGPTVAYGLIRRALDAAETNDLAAQLDLEAALQKEAAATPDHAEGVRAFAEKRSPRFVGRGG